MQIVCEYNEQLPQNNTIQKKTKETIINQKIISFNNENLSFENINKNKGILKFFLEINNQKSEKLNFFLKDIKSDVANNKEYNLKFGKSNEIKFSINFQNSSRNNIINTGGGNKFKDILSFFSNKAKESENVNKNNDSKIPQKMRYSATNDLNNTIKKLNSDELNKKEKSIREIKDNKIKNEKNNFKDDSAKVTLKNKENTITKIEKEKKNDNNLKNINEKNVKTNENRFEKTKSQDIKSITEIANTYNNKNDLNKKENIPNNEDLYENINIEKEQESKTEKNKNIITNNNPNDTTSNNNEENKNNKPFHKTIGDKIHNFFKTKFQNISNNFNTNNQPPKPSEIPRSSFISTHKTLSEISFTKTSSIIEKPRNSLLPKNNNNQNYTRHESISTIPNLTIESYLESTTYENFIKKNPKKIIENRETFCSGFFIASFPKKNGKVVENSDFFRPPCGHFKCSKLPAMKPEIIFRYPLKDNSNLDINNLAASICFPTGIKICYFENNPTIMKDYVTPITNQKGQRYYMMTYHFFHKMQNNIFTKEYEEHPLKHHLKRFGDAYLSMSEDELTENITKEIQESLDLCQELGFKDIVYIPYCLCLISKYPYVRQMEKSLQSIYYLMINNCDINDLIMFLIHSIPIPNINSKLKFNIPFYNNGIELMCPKLHDINIMNINVTKLLQWFSIDNIIIILRLILFEQKILFIDDNYERLSNVIDTFVSLIYPFQWIHTYIPIMSEEMTSYIETFLPFVNGIHSSLIPVVKKIIKELCNSNDEAFYMIYITENKINLSSIFKNNFIDEYKFIQENIPNLPSNLEKDLKLKLKKVKDEIDLKINNYKNEKQKIREMDKFDLKLRHIFIELFVDMFHDYYKYICVIDNDDVIFNKKLFMDKIPEYDKHFYEEFIETQSFQQFTQSIIENKEDYNYFKTMIIHNKKYSKYLFNNNKNDFSYYIIPDIPLNFEFPMKDFKKTEDKIKKIININKLNLDENGILPNTQRIINNIKNINNDLYDNKKCEIYLMPEIENNNSNTQDKEMEKFNMDFQKKVERKQSHENYNDKEKNNKKSLLADEKERDEVEEYIRDFTIKIFKSEKIDDLKIKKEIQSAVDSNIGREYFVNLLMKNIINNNMILVELDSFELLGSIIYNSLLYTLKIEETEKLLEQIVILVKSTKFIGKNDYGRTATLWENYKTRIQLNPKINQVNFWEIWYKLDIEYKEKNDKNKKESILNLCDVMIDLELPKSFIKNVVQGLTNNTFGKDSETSKNIFGVFIKKIVSAKYISQLQI